MEKIKNFLKERRNGFFLLVIASFIIVGFSSDFLYAGSKESQNQPEGGQVLAEEETRGSEDDNLGSNAQEIIEEGNDTSEEPAEESGDTSEETVDETSAPDPEKDRCDDLKRLLKKYCGKNYNVKKCRKYLIETKDLSKKDDQCKSLYKKYHFVPKKEEKKDENSGSSTNSGVADVKEEAILAIDYAGSKANDEYKVAIEPGMTVMGMMRKAKENSSLSYDESADWPGYIQEINNVREDISKSVFWMLYSNGGMASEGASTLKVKSGDRIEWKFMQVSLW